MRLITIQEDGIEQLAISYEERCVLIDTINKMEKTSFPVQLSELLVSGELDNLIAWYNQMNKQRIASVPFIHRDDITYAPPLRQPNKILGVGMNYMEKAIELSGKAPTSDPVTFMKPLTSLIGHNEAIELPSVSDKVTAEGELAIIIGKTCKNVTEQEAPAYVAGLTPAIDVTAKDIHAENPRFLQRSKSFDTFFSFGPEVITIDEFSDLQSLHVDTMHNNEVMHTNMVANMMYSPWFIVSFFSQGMTLNPGDVIMTGTPGSVRINEGDTVGCNISGFYSLNNNVTESIS